MAASSSCSGSGRTTRSKSEKQKEPEKLKNNNNDSVKKATKQIEVVDLCSSTDDDDDDEFDVDVYEKEENEGDGFRTVVDFESDDSLPNLTVKSFLRDCYLQPKILCHKAFRFVRNFMSEATGVSFDIPLEAPYQLEHEDNTFSVDKGDEYLDQLKERLLESEDDDPTNYYWATITPIQKKADLGLMIFKWAPLPMTLPILEMYICFCKSKYVPPKPKPKRSPPVRKRITRRTRAAVKTGLVLEEEMEHAAQMEVEEQNEDNGVDVYIKDFVEVFQLARNMEIEERLQGDIEAKLARKQESKEEPESSIELDQLMRENHKNSMKQPGLGRTLRESDSESSSDSASSSSSARSEYKGKYIVKRVRKRNTRKVKHKDTRKASSQKAPNHLPKVNGVILNGGINNTIKHKIATSKDGDGASTTSSKSRLKIICDICQPPKVFASKKSLYKHLTRIHSSRKRELVKCVMCGISTRKERLSFHKKFCVKSIVGNGR